MAFCHSVHLAGPIGLCRGIRKDFGVNQWRRTAFTDKAFKFLAGRQPPAAAKLLIRLLNGLLNFFMVECQHFADAAGPVPDLSNRAAQPVNTMTQIHHQMIACQEIGGVGGRARQPQTKTNNHCCQPHLHPHAIRAQPRFPPAAALLTNPSPTSCNNDSLAEINEMFPAKSGRASAKFGMDFATSSDACACKGTVTSWISHHLLACSAPLE